MIKRTLLLALIFFGVSCSLQAASAHLTAAIDENCIGDVWDIFDSASSRDAVKEMLLARNNGLTPATLAIMNENIPVAWIIGFFACKYDLFNDAGFAQSLMFVDTSIVDQRVFSDKQGKTAGMLITMALVKGMYFIEVSAQQVMSLDSIPPQVKKDFLSVLNKHGLGRSVI